MHRARQRARKATTAGPADTASTQNAPACAESDAYRDGPCIVCGTLVDRSQQREEHRQGRKTGRPRVYFDTCFGHKAQKQRPIQHRRAEEFRFADIFSEPIDEADREVLERLFDMAHVGRWSVKTLRHRGDQLRRVLDANRDDRPIPLSRVRAELGSAVRSRIVAQVLDQSGLLVDDTVPTTRRWIDRQTASLPPGFRDDVRAWLLVLHKGEPRARPRAEATLHTYFSRVHAPLTEWAHTRSHLREVTKEDVAAVLNRLTGHKRFGTFVALRSLFRFAKSHRLIFLDPTRRLHCGAAPRRTLLPMTDDQVDTVTGTAVTPMQRLVVALVAIYAARATPLRLLTLDNIDLPRRRIRIGGTVHPLTEFAHDTLTSWLTFRQHRWPGTPNPHLIVSADSVLGTAPVTDDYLTWHLNLLGVQLEHIRGDRILQEAFSTNADPLRLVIAFGLSEKTAVEYTDLARTLMERPVEAATHASAEWD
ncbi:hypothetical protein ACWEO2_18500 [Nocardia sp. NPDC004278]